MSDYCTGLTSAVFLGDAPGTFGAAVFDDTAPGFTIYYLSGSTGFTSPTPQRYKAIEIDEAAYPAATWLLEHGFPYDTDLDQDTSGDGVSLLMAFALNLDPTLNLRGSLPAPVVNGESLGMSFNAGVPGITYTAQTSTDLQNWTSEGVILSELDPNSRRTASVDRDMPQRYLRLLVGVEQ